MRIKVLCVGKVRTPYSDDCNHYSKLLGRHSQVEVAEVKEAGLDAQAARQAVELEAEVLAGRIGERDYVCALDGRGKQLSSEGFADFLEQRRQQGRDVVFLIGGAFGLADSLVERADFQLSLGELTLPHQLARVVLLEQLFRAHKIIARERYHY